MSAGEEIDQANYKKQLERTQSSDSDAIKKEPPLKTDPRFVSQNFAQTYPVPHANTYQKILESCGKFFGGWGTFCCLCSNPYKEVREGDVGLVLTFGKLINIKTNIREIPAQSCYTRDNAIFSIDDIHSAVIERTQTTLRDVIGNRILQDVLEKREEIAESIEQIISKTAFDWGVNIESILIKDLQLPQSVQQSLSKASESKRIGEAKIIMAKAETDAARQMRKASDILSSPAALQIRYLDALQNMSKNPGTRVIFMPSSDAIEKIAHAPTANHQQQPLEPISENSTGRTDINQSREITNTMALQEALRDDYLWFKSIYIRL
ncbi:hypothetical protein QCA50_010001 [Cerrena zonata]|uniref:Band 7 domain-containing protein n=1 Tax=Cerrena zonata TaxID=2478898 RepID=A0AAW0G5C9_9APHY